MPATYASRSRVPAGGNQELQKRAVDPLIGDGIRHLIF
jgi:hypothetical protein